MDLRRAETAELEKVCGFYFNLIDKMQDKSTVIGWKKGIYPSDGYLSESIEKGELFVLDGGEDYLACVILNSLWNEGYEGLAWSIECTADEVLVPHALGVNPAVQGTGIGRRVVREIIKLAKAEKKKTVRLDILGGNTAADRLYTGTGFRPVGAKNMFYEDTGWTEYVMYELIL